MDKSTVILNRRDYIGGSDCPMIMGISEFHTKWWLLQYKAGIIDNDFEGNRYTEYGDAMEGKIRDFVNEKFGREFKPDVRIKGRFRGNTDGIDEFGLLEVKTTSHIYESLDEYKQYLVQMIFYCIVFEKSNCYLAVYERPDDFSEEFEEERLHVYYMELSEYADLAAELEDAIDEFIKQWDALKENPLLTEEDFIPHELVNVAHAVMALEDEIAEIKEKEKELKELKADLKAAMEASNIDGWTMPGGTKITLVRDGEDKIVKEINTKKLEKEYPNIAKAFMEEKVRKGRAGYVRITQAK